jgi:hypothetical protein
MDMLEIDESCTDSVMSLVRRGGGGSYDDGVFASGWRLDELAATLARPGISALADAIRPHERARADLIAMAHGYTMTLDAVTDAGWLLVTFTRIGDGWGSEQ